MNSYNNRSNPHNFRPTKGTGVYQNPSSITAGNIRPITNNDLTNFTTYKHGSARPMKHYRKGIVSNIPTVILDPCCPDFDIVINQNRASKNQRTKGLLGQLMDQPGRNFVQNNIPN
jgi:hypothetical protein